MPAETPSAAMSAPTLPASVREEYRALEKRRAALLSAGDAGPGVKAVSVSTAGASQSVTMMTAEEWWEEKNRIEARMHEIVSGEPSAPPRFSHVVQDLSRF